MVIDDPALSEFLTACVVGLVLGAAAAAARFLVVVALVVGAAALTYLLVTQGVPGVEAAMWVLLEQVVQQKVFAAGLGVGGVTGAVFGERLATRSGGR